MLDPDGWSFRERRGTAEDLHEKRPPDVAVSTIDRLYVDGPAFALGSTQDASEISRQLVSSQEIEVVRRRSGGGAVLLVPGEHVWIDVWLPNRDRRWHRDVSLAARWIGEAWLGAAAAFGFKNLRLHVGRADRTKWALRVCFAGAGPGEVFVGGHKLVGVSQWRSRDWTRFQCLVHRRWDPERTFSLFETGDCDNASWPKVKVAEIGDLDIERTFRAALART